MPSSPPSLRLRCGGAFSNFSVWAAPIASANSRPLLALSPSVASSSFSHSSTPLDSIPLSLKFRATCASSRFQYLTSGFNFTGAIEFSPRSFTVPRYPRASSQSPAITGFCLGFRHRAPVLLPHLVAGSALTGPLAFASVCGLTKCLHDSDPIALVAPPTPLDPGRLSTIRGGFRDVSILQNNPPTTPT